MNYYNEIKNELINNEINRKVKNYSINRSDLDTYYNVGKILSEAGSHYGDGIINEYSKRLTNDLGKGYSKRNWYRGYWPGSYENYEMKYDAPVNAVSQELFFLLLPIEAWKIFLYESLKFSTYVEFLRKVWYNVKCSRISTNAYAFWKLIFKENSSNGSYIQKALAPFDWS